MGDWLCFDDSEEQDDAEWEQDKEREGDGVSEDGETDGQVEEGFDGTISERISEEFGDVSCISFDFFPTAADDTTKGEIEITIFLQNIQVHSKFSRNNPQHSLVEQHLQHYVPQFSGKS